MNRSTTRASREGRQIAQQPIVLADDVAMGDENYVHISGSAKSLRARGLGLPADFTSAPDDKPVVIAGADGFDWEVWGECYALTARRPRTTAERDAYFDDLNARSISAFFTNDRLRTVELIAIELMATADALSDKPTAAQAKALRFKLDRLGAVQWALARNSRMNMTQVRRDLADVGLSVRMLRRDVEAGVH